MNEEEKKSIEDMNRFSNGIDMSCVTARQMQIILNLIKKLQKENEELKIKNNAIKRESEAYAENMIRLDIEKQDYFEKHRYHLQQNESLTKEFSNVIPVQKVKDKIEELQKEYNKLDKQVDEYIKTGEKDVSIYYENKERISIMQTLSYFIDILKELIEEREEKE